MRNPYKDLVLNLEKEYSDVCSQFNWSNDFCYFILDKYYFSIAQQEYDDEQALNLIVRNRNNEELVANLTTMYSEVAFNFIKQLLK